MAAKDQWGSRAGFIMAAVGSAVGLGNIWRFPSMAYENGGGAFLVPYLFAVFTAGAPLLIMEFCLGKRSGRGAPGALAALGRGWRKLGWWQVVICFLIMTYYAVILGWTACYAVFAATGAWGTDPKAFFFDSFLAVSSGPLDLGGLRWTIVLAVAGVWAATWLVIWRGVHRGIELACKILIPMLVVILVVMLVLSLHLPGAIDGVNWLFQPDFSHLLDFRVWADAYGQVFYSASVFFAIMIAYASYLPEDADISGSAITTVCLNSGFSLLAGTMIFSMLGSLALGRGVPLDHVVDSGVSLAFITVPAAIDIMPLPGLTGALFFSALLLAGLSSIVSMSEAVASPLIRASGKSRHAVTSLVCLGGFLASLIFSTGGGLHLLDLADHFLSSYGLIVVGLLELMLFAWFSGKIEDMRRFANATSDFAIGRLWLFCLRWLNPPLLAVTIILLAWDDLAMHVDGEFSPQAVILGVGLMLLSVAAMFVANWLDPRRAGDGAT